MDDIIKQHLICGSYQEICDYFKKVVPFAGDPASVNDCFEIPTMSIKNQLETINNIKLPKLGFVFYFSRIVSQDQKLEIIPKTECVYISDEFVQNKFGEIVQCFANTDVMEGKLPKI